MFYSVIFTGVFFSSLLGASVGDMGADCYDCEEKKISNFEDYAGINKYCTEGTKVKCPSGTACQTVKMKFRTKYEKLSQSVELLNSTCRAVNKKGDLCSDIMKMSKKSVDKAKLLSCDVGVDIRSNRIFPDKENEDDKVPASSMCDHCASFTSTSNSGGPDPIFRDMLEDMQPCNNSNLHRCLVGEHCTDLFLDYETSSSQGEIRVVRCTESELTCDIVNREFGSDMEISYCSVNGGEERKYRQSIGQVKKNGKFEFNFTLREGEKRPSQDFLKSFSVHHCGKVAEILKTRWRKGAIRLSGKIDNIKACKECTYVKVKDKLFGKGYC